MRGRRQDTSGERKFYSRWSSRSTRLNPSASHTRMVRLFARQLFPERDAPLMQTTKPPSGRTDRAEAYSLHSMGGLLLMNMMPHSSRTTKSYGPVPAEASRSAARASMSAQPSTLVPVDLTLDVPLWTRASQPCVRYACSVGTCQSA